MNSGESLGTAFATRPNALNAVRLALAATVVVWHAYLLPGPTGIPAPVHQLLERMPVDCFFAISGFLIVRSWERQPNVRRYLLARALRILPGLWVCLLITAFVIAPLAGVQAPALGEQLRYVFGNAAVFITEPTIGASGGTVWAGIWNLSLWTLWWEVCAYLTVLALGVAGWLRPRVIVGLAATLWSLLVSVSMLQGRAWIQAETPIVAIPRLGLMFALGALLWFYRDRIPMSRAMATLAVAAVVAGAFLPQYLVVAAPGVAYLCLWGGINAGRWSRLRFRNDVSYGVYIYGAAIQTALLLVGVSLSWPAFTVLSLAIVVPLAWLSWLLVERPVMRLGRSKRETREPVAAGQVTA